ncbi:aprataxin-like isoform X1 [Haliotis rufescens]|uniref:aprataxin-like isoform X1 n=1 Tax=Haliotis rufescens TaxID=6454 RepID=UPI001EB0396B|nr:aprataxin-like isoform X1 [Haliotis rufescens]
MMAAGAKRKGEMGEAPGAKRTPGHWSQGLLSSMDDPELRVDADDKVVIIKDKYPKALHHFLILPKEKIANLKKLKSEHILLLKHIHKKGIEIAEKADKNLQFRFGYHAVPSMSHLHMHVISQDFNSPFLKTKKHWNSFTTEYFIDSKDILDQLEDKGRVETNTTENEQLLKRELRCHKCSKMFSTMPALKSHIVLHNVSKKKS